MKFCVLVSNSGYAPAKCQLKLNHWENSKEVIKWLVSIKKITKYAEECIDISKEDNTIIRNSRKPFLFNKSEALTKER